MLHDVLGSAAACRSMRAGGCASHRCDCACVRALRAASTLATGYSGPGLPGLRCMRPSDSVPGCIFMKLARAKASHSVLYMVGRSWKSVLVAGASGTHCGGCGCLVAGHVVGTHCQQWLRSGGSSQATACVGFDESDPRRWWHCAAGSWWWCFTCSVDVCRCKCINCPCRVWSCVRASGGGGSQGAQAALTRVLLLCHVGEHVGPAAQCCVVGEAVEAGVPCVRLYGVPMLSRGLAGRFPYGSYTY